jgi:DNA replication licensing factor MCM2
VVESEGEGEDLLDQMQTDYRAIPELDRYDDRQLDDDSDVSEITFSNRAAAEALMQQRDRRNRAVRSRLPAALQDMYDAADKGEGLDEDDEDEEAEERRRRRRMEEAADGLDDTSFDNGLFSALPTQEDDETPYDLTGVQGFVKDWILLDRPRREVKRLFRKFLHEYHNENLQLVYKDRIQQMCAANQQSLKVNYKHLAKNNPRVAIWLADAPRQVISLFDEVALEEVLKQFPNYEDTHRTIHVRITDLPICDAIRSLRQIHTNALVRIAGT